MAFKITFSSEYSVIVESIYESGNETVSLTERVLGRCPCENIEDKNGQTIVKTGNIIEESHLERIDNLGIKNLFADLGIFLIEK